LEERYGFHDGFVARIKEAVEHDLRSRLLLPADAQAIISDAEASMVLR
jgi:hypothetical protein